MDHRRSKDQYEAEEESLEGLEGEERLKKIRSLRWVHYPQFDSWDGDFFQEAEEELMKEERAEARAREWQKAQREAGDPAYQGLEFEFTKPTPSNDKGILVASGGAGGYGNPHFLTLKNRSPKFATRGKPGGRITLEFELKLLADIGLVGFPNAGKSTILRALTRSRAEVAPYAFTTLNPQVGTVRVWEDGRYEAVDHRLEAQSTPIEDSVLEREKQEEIIKSGGYPSSSKKSDHGRLQGEALRFTIADNPGLIARASENVGLGHAFLKSIERSLALVYVVDLSGDAPWDELRILKNELEKYKPGLSSNARVVLANKADLLDDSDPEKVAIAKQKLKRLEDAVRDIEKDYPLDLTSPADQDLALTSVSEPFSRPPIDVVPISAKYKLNLELAVEHMARYVTEARGLQPE
ncbi:GTPase of the mitochondrial inner membrane that associates with the large ribosomal subunit [Tulasnella sp. 419]|nr:GTPase of the mitochondrial inner membrane that associates with the large ribosomal subunit [Tulasnella sp. 419]